MDVSESYLKESIGVGLSLKGDWRGCQVGWEQQKQGRDPAVIRHPFHCRIYIHIMTFYFKPSLQSAHFTSTSSQIRGCLSLELLRMNINSFVSSSTEPEKADGLKFSLWAHGFLSYSGLNWHPEPWPNFLCTTRHVFKSLEPVKSGVLLLPFSERFLRFSVILTHTSHTTNELKRAHISVKAVLWSHFKPESGCGGLAPPHTGFEVPFSSSDGKGGN